ncbi:hypothetical protein GXY_11529 [Novacetimonas hansenii ATCC 23769]|uniref:Uncharacterized protein n=1 Tax=Novacetimonas hansenii ATCC 23769 TaxID=714995 RepID=D5QGN4_NOVHA|nr:hypothetical protein GXY_11529 [Novacetimonas hansenii ATCC 23769]
MAAINAGWGGGRRGHADPSGGEAAVFLPDVSARARVRASSRRCAAASGSHT